MQSPPFGGCSPVLVARFPLKTGDIIVLRSNSQDTLPLGDWVVYSQSRDVSLPQVKPIRLKNEDYCKVSGGQLRAMSGNVYKFPEGNLLLLRPWLFYDILARNAMLPDPTACRWTVFPVDFEVYHLVLPYCT